MKLDFHQSRWELLLDQFYLREKSFHHLFPISEVELKSLNFFRDNTFSIFHYPHRLIYLLQII